MKLAIPFSLRVTTALAFGAIISIFGVYAITTPDLFELGIPSMGFGLIWDVWVILLARTLLRAKKREGV